MSNSNWKGLTLGNHQRKSDEPSSEKVEKLETEVSMLRDELRMVVQTIKDLQTYKSLENEHKRMTTATAIDYGKLMEVVRKKALCFVPNALSSSLFKFYPTQIR